ncbi:MAG: hypothetical protein JXA62_01880 [Candidatus Aminicenantes bacterium]|nr:hypothetical protein [Candidatus Aminicenantes bacterium]
MTRSDSTLQFVLQFLSRHVGEWMAYLGVRAAVMLAAVLVLSLMLVLGRTVFPVWFIFMFPLPPLLFICARPVLRRKEWRLMSLFLHDTTRAPIPRRGVFQLWLPAALDALARDSGATFSSTDRSRMMRRWRLERMALELLALLPFLGVGVALAWHAPWPLLVYVIVSAMVVGWGFAAGSLAPVFILVLTARAFPEACGENSIIE